MLPFARKYRPNTFSEVVGQDHVVQAIKNSLDRNRLHHAWLFTGTRGVGKTTLARLLAKALNCDLGISSNPCNKCSQCIDIFTGKSIDVIELDAASNTQVENMRDLLETTLYTPSSCRFKVYIIDEVHMLSKSAFNSMLKTLEEPPEFVKFILATTDPEKIPITILSRCLKFNLKRVGPEVISVYLEKIVSKEKIEYETDCFNLIGNAADGSVRDALSLLDLIISYSNEGKITNKSVLEIIGSIDKIYLKKLLIKISENDSKGLIETASEIYELGFPLERILMELTTLIHKIIIFKSVPSAYSTEGEFLESISAKFLKNELQLLYQIATYGARDFNLAPNEYVAFSITILRMLEYIPRKIESVHFEKENEVLPNNTHLKKLTLSNENWSALIDELNLKGFEAELASNCEIKKFENNSLVLMLRKEHEHLLKSTIINNLLKKLKENFDTNLELKFIIEDVKFSPKKIKESQQRKEEDQALKEVKNDKLINNIVEEFDAKIEYSSLKKINK